MSVVKILNGFDPSNHERLDDGQSFREVYAVEADYPGVSDDLVVKHVGEDQSVGRAQNRKEVRAYLESVERDQDFLTTIYGGTSDFEYVVARRVNPVPAPKPGHPWHQNNRRGMFEDQCRDVLPEGWNDLDDSELGFEQGEVKLMDGGALHRSDWLVYDPLDHDMVSNSSNYFTVEN